MKTGCVTFDRSRTGIMLAAACVATVVAGWGGTALAAGPAAGDVYVYRLVNGYNKETRGQLHYQVSKVDSDSTTVEVTPDTAEGGVQRTDVYTRSRATARRWSTSSHPPIPPTSFRSIRARPGPRAFRLASRAPRGREACAWTAE